MSAWRWDIVGTFGKLVCRCIIRPGLEFAGLAGNCTSDSKAVQFIWEFIMLCVVCVTN